MKRISSVTMIWMAMVVLATAWNVEPANDKLSTKLEIQDIFQLEYASDPQISPAGDPS